MTEPPFMGTKVTDDISMCDIEPLIDREMLFSSRWQFRKGMKKNEWEDLKASKVLPIYERIVAKCRAKDIIIPRIAYGYFKCRNSEVHLFVEGERKTYKFDFPRERVVPHRCIADLFSGGIAAFQIVTVGDGVNKEAVSLFKNDAYSDSFYLKGFAAEAAEALASLNHRKIRKELGASDDHGERFSPGYPSFPDLLDQRKVVELLDAKRIGVSLTKTCMFIPEHSTSAIISVDPKAMHFNPNIS
jgi:5-methyltetrahydrofolate--homocysteine methyltransferase